MTKTRKRKSAAIKEDNEGTENVASGKKQRDSPDRDKELEIEVEDSYTAPAKPVTTNYQLIHKPGEPAFGNDPEECEIVVASKKDQREISDGQSTTDEDEDAPRPAKPLEIKSESSADADSLRDDDTTSAKATPKPGSIASKVGGNRQTIRNKKESIHSTVSGKGAIEEGSHDSSRKSVRSRIAGSKKSKEPLPMPSQPNVESMEVEEAKAVKRETTEEPAKRELTAQEKALEKRANLKKLLEEKQNRPLKKARRF